MDGAMAKILGLLGLLLLAGCATNGFSTYYNDEGYDITDFIALKQGEKVQLIDTMEPDKKIKEFEKQGYIVLGTSSFSSEYEPFSKAIQTAKEKGATVVILNSDVSGTQTKTNTVATPQTNTTYHHGYVNSWNSPYSASYSGVSTTHSTQYYSYNYNVTVFNQVAYFLAKKI